MKVATLFNQGLAKEIEDGSFLCPPFFGVLDGVSQSYTPKTGPAKYHGLTGGQTVVEIVINTFHSSYAKRDVVNLDSLLREANDAARKWALANNLPMEEVDKLPATALAAAHIQEEIVDIAIAGDCLAVWKLKNGEKGASKNLTFYSEKEQADKFAELMIKYGGNRQKCWEEFLPFQDWSYRAYRNRKCWTPNVFGVLNGQPEFLHLLQTYQLPKEKLELLILATDGLVLFEDTANPNLAANKILDGYAIGGLPKLLQNIRIEEKARCSTSWVTYREATAIAIEF